MRLLITKTDLSMFTFGLKSFQSEAGETRSRCRSWYELLGVQGFDYRLRIGGSRADELAVEVKELNCQFWRNFIKMVLIDTVLDQRLDFESRGILRLVVERLPAAHVREGRCNLIIGQVREGIAAGEVGLLP